MPLVWQVPTWSAGKDGVRLRKSWPSSPTRSAALPAERPSQSLVAKADRSRASRTSRAPDTGRQPTAAAERGKLRWRSQPTEVHRWRAVSARAVVRTSGRSASPASRRVLDPFQPTRRASTGDGGGQAVTVAATEAVPSDELRLPGAEADGPADSDTVTDALNLPTEDLPPPQGLSPSDDNPPPPPGMSPIGPSTSPPDAPKQFPPSLTPQEMPPAQRIEAEDLARGRAQGLQQEECDTAISKLRAHRLDQIALDIRVTGEAGNDYPIECELGAEPAPSRHWPETIYTWKASGVCHKPLYFNEFALERHGHSKGPFIQPLYSGAHFYVNLAALPYKMGLRPPTECVYSLGHYRAGSCAPYLVPTPPLSLRAGLAQAGAAVGVAAILP